MQKNKLFRYGFAHSAGVVLYVLFIVTLMNNGKYLFGGVSEIFIGAMMLLLFVLSATIVGSLVLVRPILWYWDGNKKEALQLFFYTLSCLALWLVIGFSFLALTHWFGYA